MWDFLRRVVEAGAAVTGFSLQGRRTLASLGVHETLQAWQDGEITYRQAFKLVGVETLKELYEAARNSDVEIKFTMAMVDCCPTPTRGSFSSTASSAARAASDPPMATGADVGAPRKLGRWP